ncbi:hypothetical protein [uncultured Marixanthomonas sp.]|uniref:hypothetical protein n=1 Tax=uncultured Marixanthomonas sp. TaxID=757245 RepID=UPI0030DBF8C1
MNKQDVYISEGNRPLWHRIIAALCYTLMLVCAYKSTIQPNISWLYAASFLFSTGVTFSLVRDYHFDFEKKRYKTEKCIGPLKFGKWKDFKKLEYISIFKNGKGFYEVNLWYNRNKHFNITTLDNFQDCFDIGKSIAEKLKIDFLDAATDPRNSIWVKL